MTYQDDYYDDYTDDFAAEDASMRQDDTGVEACCCEPYPNGCCPPGPRGPRGFRGPAGPTAPSIYAQQGKCRNHAAFSTLKTIKHPL